MRDPENLHRPYEFLEDAPDIIKIDDLPAYNLYDYDLNDEKSFKKYIENVEKAVRGSYEYKSMIRYLREYLDMNKCSFYLNVNNIDSTKIKIEVHHDPIDLRTICTVVYKKRCAFNESLEEEMVAKEVMFLHYQLSVGLIPLAETVHELVHNQYIFIPTTAVYGNYKDFVERYKPWFAPEDLDMLERIENISIDYEDNYKTILSKKYLYVDMSGAYTLPRTQDIISMIKGRIGDILDAPTNQSGEKV